MPEVPIAEETPVAEAAAAATVADTIFGMVAAGGNILVAAAPAAETLAEASETDTSDVCGFISHEDLIVTSPSQLPPLVIFLDLQPW